ncbi:hypothetical protein AUC69_00820 [Methyloceanibacter superfactus]|uniref:Glycosyltransferase 2-like domain-containing protein n=2 Tax=Methyloceanibacter superfactus TaxID=1774969 RepID=A0A1E3W3U4_9HYPH|nr:hypothetical protein AUC69_00820 [Methyloceanibacter superfactus]
MLAQLAPYDIALATPRAVRDAVYHHFAPVLARGAVETLAMRRPAQSARMYGPRWQRLSFIAGATALMLALLLAPSETVRGVTLLLGVVFVPVIGLRAVAAYGLMRQTEDTAPQSRVPDADLPTYTILAPLFREAHMLPSLVHALRQLDWPAAKLDIKLILEATDRETVAAARALSLPGNVEIVVVPVSARAPNRRR